MKKILSVIILLVLLISEGKAQNIQITKFERNFTSLIASTNPVYDNAGEACAMVRFFVRDMGFTIEANLGVVKTDTLSGEIRLWIPTGTKRITVRHEGMLPLSGYEIPLRIESKATYEATIEITNEQFAPKENSKKGFRVYLGAGYNVLSIAGLSANLGFEWNKHQMEVGAVYGLGKSDNLFFYDKSGEVTAAHNYQPLRVQMRCGYEIDIADILSITPQVGGAYHFIKGNSVQNFSGLGSSYRSLRSFSVLGAVRLTAKMSDHFRIHVTPEYDFGVYKDGNCKWISDADKTIKSWTDGLSLNVGVMVFF